MLTPSYRRVGSMYEAENLEVDSAEALERDRRRVGRAEVASSLVPLLREPAASTAVDGDDDDGRWEPMEPLGPPRGILLGVVLCIPIWAAIGWLLYAMVR